MGTGMNDRSAVAGDLGSMFGMLVFFESAVDGLLSGEHEISANDLFPGEIETLADVHLCLRMATKSFERFIGQLGGVDKAAFVAAVASTAQCVSDQAFNGSGEISE